MTRNGLSKARNPSPKSQVTPAFHLVILGAAGGPLEDNITGLLVRSTATKWAKDSVLAVDAGTHLAGIARILEASKSSAEIPATRTPSNRRASPRKQRQPPASPRNSQAIQLPSDAPTAYPFSFQGSNAPINCPFGQLAASLPFSHASSSSANAAHIARTYISTYLVTHAHLDHVSGLIVNTASFQFQYRTRRIAALPSTIQALKNHVFNDVIWPNMSDEDGGIGLLSYMRLTEGGNIAAGSGEGAGYVEVCEGLAAKGYHVSHGHCFRQQSRTNSTQHEGLEELSDEVMALAASRTAAKSSLSMGSADTGNKLSRMNVYDSSMFFIRDQATGSEVAIFGDVEPDTISVDPRNARVWAEAAQKFVEGRLRAIVIECSYDDSQSDAMLFGHVNPRHLMAELGVMAQKVHQIASDSLKPRAEPSGRRGAISEHNSIDVQDPRKRKREVSNSRVGWEDRAPKWPPQQPSTGSGRAPSHERRRPSLGALINLQQANERRAESRERSARGISAQRRSATFPPPGTYNGYSRSPHKLSEDSTASTTDTKRPSTEMSYTGTITPPLDDDPRRKPSQAPAKQSPRQMSGKYATPPAIEGPANGDPVAMRKTWDDARRPLGGLPVVIIHMKETLDGREEGVGVRIKRDLERWEQTTWKTGVRFFISEVGMSLYL